MIIGHIGLIQKTKKQDFVLNVISELYKKGIDVIGIFPGEVREQDYMDFLKENTKKLGLEKRVLFLGRRNDIPELLKVIDILIIPSFEGFPLVGLEAAASGVPVVACDVAGAREFILESKCGVMFKEDSVESATLAILEALQSKDMYIENGKAFVSSMSMKSYQDRLLRMILEVLKEVSDE